MAIFKNSIVSRILDNVTDHLGETATFSPCNGNKIVVRLVFDNRAELVDPDTETVVSSNQPRILVKLSDYPNGIEKGDKFILENAKYTAWTVQEDGQGGASVLLHKVEL